MTRPYRVAFSADFRMPGGAPAYPDFDLTPIFGDPRIEVTWLPVGERIRSGDLEDTDALVLLVPRFDADSIPASGRLGLVARFGVGYDSVDVAACSAAGSSASSARHSAGCQAWSAGTGLAPRRSWPRDRTASCARARVATRNNRARGRACRCCQSARCWERCLQCGRALVARRRCRRQNERVGA